MSEYAHVERPLLTQLAALGWTVIDQGNWSGDDVVRIIRSSRTCGSSAGSGS